MSYRSKNPNRGGNKRGRPTTGAGPSAPPLAAAEEPQRWRSPAHGDRYRLHTLHRPLVKERVFFLREGEQPPFYNNITRRGWRNFCQLPRESSEDICKEFYANAYNFEQGIHRQYVSYVRGKEVRYDSATIQRLLKTAHYDRTTEITCEYRLKQEYIQQSQDELDAAEDVLECIALPGVQWELTKNNRPRRIKIKDLKPPVRIWYHFVVSTIMPTANHTEVGLWRAVLLWAIMTGAAVDLPTILANSIYDFAHDASPKASLGHSSLIQYICEGAGVEIPPPEQRKVTLFPEMNVRWIAKTLGIPMTEEVREDMPAGRAAPQRRAAGGPSQTLETRVTTLEAEVRFMRQRTEYEYDRQHSFQDYVSSQLAYLCTARPDGPPPFQPAPYDASEEHAYYAAQAGIYDARQDMARAGGDDTADIPDIVRDAEDEEMQDD